jgi:alpha-tubulin suppressor-like RCC1 family protein
VHARRVYAGVNVLFAVGEAGELFSWGKGSDWCLGHGDEQDQPSPTEVEALQGVRASSVAVGGQHVLALSEDGLVYRWGEDVRGNIYGDHFVERELLPEPVEALRGVRVGGIAAAGNRFYAVSDAGEVWAWGSDVAGSPPLGHGETTFSSLPKPIESLRGIKVDAVAAGIDHTLAWAGDGSVYGWGANSNGALGPAMTDPLFHFVRMPQLLPGFRVARWPPTM